MLKCSCQSLDYLSAALMKYGSVVWLGEWSVDFYYQWISLPCCSWHQGDHWLIWRTEQVLRHYLWGYHFLSLSTWMIPHLRLPFVFTQQGNQLAISGVCQSCSRPLICSTDVGEGISQTPSRNLGRPRQDSVHLSELQVFYTAHQLSSRTALA